MSHSETAEEEYGARKIACTSLSLSNVLHIAAWAKLCFAFHMGISEYFTSKRSSVLIE